MCIFWKNSIWNCNLFASTVNDRLCWGGDGQRSMLIFGKIFKSSFYIKHRFFFAINMFKLMQSYRKSKYEDKILKIFCIFSENSIWNCGLFASTANNRLH